MKWRWTSVIALCAFCVTLLVACNPTSEFDNELQAVGLLDDEGNYLYEVPITHFGTPYGTLSTAVELLADVLSLWADQFGGREVFIEHVIGGNGVTSIILDYTGTMTADKAVFISKGNEKFPIGTLAINMPVHLDHQTGALQRTEFKMSVAHELAHGFDYKNGLAPSAEFERAGAGALSAYHGEILPENFAETVAAFMIGQGRAVGEGFTREWLTAYMVLPYLSGDEAIPYDPADWPPDEE